MSLTKQLATILPLGLIVLGLLSYNFMSAQWIGPTATAPANNTAKPINVSSTTQSKAGSFNAYILSAATSTWSPRYCDELGQNCFDTNDVGVGGGGVTMADFYTYSTNQNPQSFPERTACSCQPKELLTGCSGFQRGDNDTAQLSGGRNGCYSDGSTVAQCHCMGSGSRTLTYAWNTTAWGYCSPTSSCSSTGTQGRTVTCKRSDGVTVASTFCSGTKPATSQPCSAYVGGSCR